MSDGDRYRLGSVREARARDERVRRGELADAASDARATQARADAAATRVDTAREALAEARRHREDLVARGTTSSTLARAELFIARRSRELEAAHDAHTRARAAHRGQLDAFDGARDRLTRARADKEVIERHFARWREAKQRLAERRED